VSGTENAEADLLLHAFDVFARTGVDANAVAFFDEVRDNKFCAGFDFGVLGDVRCRVAADGRVSLSDEKDDVVRRRDADRVIVVQHDVAFHFLFEVLPVVVHEFRGKLVLFVGFRAHENVGITIAEKVLRLDLSNVGGFDGVAAFPGAFEDRSAQEVAELALVERLAFARFHELALDHDEGVAFELNFQTFAKIASVDTDHSFCPSCLTKRIILPIKCKSTRLSARLHISAVPSALDHFREF